MAQWNLHHTVIVVVILIGIALLLINIKILFVFIEKGEQCKEHIVIRHTFVITYIDSTLSKWGTLCVGGDVRGWGWKGVWIPFSPRKSIKQYDLLLFHIP